jgi:hypothetical protein
MSLPLDSWRAEMGLNPWHFWGLADRQIVPIVAECSSLVREYSWQGSDMAGRDDIRQAIRDAETKLASYLGYNVMPEYGEAEVDWPRHYQVNMIRLRDWDATGRRIAVALPSGYVQALGIEQLTMAGTATVLGGELVYSDQFSTGFDDTFTITLPTTVTDPDQIALYFATADRFDDTATGERWRIEPIQIGISGGNVVISGRRWLLVRPILYQAPNLNAIDPTNAANFVTSLEVYQRTTNGDGIAASTCQATLIYESGDCASCWGPCWCSGAPSSTDPATTGLVIARAGIRDSVLGLVTPGAASYDATAGSWTAACCTGFCDPDRVSVRYLAGYPLTNGRMDRRWQQVTARLAAAELKRRICACRDTNERLHDLQIDLTLQATETERYTTAPEDLSNPFGTRKGHVQAWREARYHILRRGTTA